jgi:1-acyl-sn-glycerol-3-phosphate acyltransferase
MDQMPCNPAAELGRARLLSLPDSLDSPSLLHGGLRLPAAVLLRFWLSAFHGLTIAGRHHLPMDRSFVLIANHTSHLDTLCLLSALPLRRLCHAFPAAAQDYFCVSPPWTLLAKVLVNALPFDRRSPWHSLQACTRLLEKPGNILLLFPEGKRSTDGVLAEFKPGVAFLAAGRDVPVVPCHLAGTHAALPKGAWCPRPCSIRLTIGTPRVYAHLPPTRPSRRLVCRELREAVIALGRTPVDAHSPTPRSHELQ